MSFKRDGDDKNALSNQRKRRVADLLYEDISDGEVTKLRNGRYMCKLCYHRPTFDTINMFQVHKQGKKHQNSIANEEMKTQELQDLILKRQHEEELKAENQQKKISEISEAKQFHGKTSQLKPFDRKTKLELSDGIKSITTDGTSIASLPGNRPGLSKKVKNVHSYNQSTEGTERCKQTKQLASKDAGHEEAVLKSNHVKNFIKQGGENSSSKFYFSRRQQTTSKHVPRVELNLERQHSVIEQHTSVSWDRFKQRKSRQFVAPVYQKKSRNEIQGKTDAVSCMTNTASTGVPNINISENLNTATQGPTNQSRDCVKNLEKKQRAQEFLNAFGAGWKRDWDGKWIRDEEVEFDSDDEPPTIT